jgi:hypothetical protein
MAVSLKHNLKKHKRLYECGRLCKRNYLYLARQFNAQQITALPLNVRQEKHGLKEKLIVSLTSYPKRYHLLQLTIRTLLRQSIKADQVILWVSEDDYGKLPENIKYYKKYGLNIFICKDLKSYKKIIPTLKAYPKACVVTADDDIYYRRDWLKELVHAYQRAPHRHVICHRAHEIILDDSSYPLSYNEWSWESKKKTSCPFLFPTGAGGIFYPPGAFPSEVFNEDAFQRFCPFADDIWLYWMASLNGRKFHLVEHPKPLKKWPDTDLAGLGLTNTEFLRGNDIQLKRMIAAYGLPWRPRPKN